jgi:hypothetical protein
MAAVFSADELVALVAEVDRQLANLTFPPMAPGKEPMDEVRSLRSQLAAQWAAIDQAAGEPADGFLRQLAAGAQKNICDKDSFLNQQLAEFGEVGREATLTVVAAALAAMGVAMPVMDKLAVAITVVIVRFGVKKFCAEYGEKG